MKPELDIFYVNETGEGSPLGSLIEAGYVWHSRGIPPYRVIDSYLVVFILEGGGFFWDVQRRVREVNAGDMLLLNPGCPHGFGPRRGNVWHEMFIHFTGRAFDLCRDGGIFHGIQPVGRMANIEEGRKRLEGIFEPGTGGKPVSQACLVSRLLGVLTMAARPVAPAEGQNAAGPPWLLEAMLTLSDVYNSRRDLHELAGHLGLTYDQFRKRFEQEVGLPPNTYRLRHRMKAACRLLIEGNLTNQEIAASLGFADEFAFSRRFKAVVGLCPREYRRSHPAGAGPAGWPESAIFAGLRSATDRDGAPPTPTPDS